MLTTGFEDNILWPHPFVASVLTSSGPIFSESTLPWPFRLWPGHSKHHCFLNRGVSNKQLPNTMCQNFVAPGYGHKPRKRQRRKGRFWNSIMLTLFENVPLLYPRKRTKRTCTYIVNFPFFNGFCFRNGAREVFRQVGRLTKHKRGAIKTKPAQSLNIPDPCFPIRACHRKPTFRPFHSRLSSVDGRDGRW